MESEYTIVGGGVAGLSACMRLLEYGVTPLVIEAGKYPSHKVCGEFFSPKGVEILQNWGIVPIEIEDAYFHIENETLHYKFPSPFGSLSHLQVDPLLMNKSEKATFLTETRVTQISVNDMHVLELSSGEKVRTLNLILATGRTLNTIPRPPAYKGFKVHLRGNFNPRALEMYLFDEGYLGISPVEGGNFNIAGLVKIELFHKWKTVGALVNHWKETNKALAKRLNVSPNWMEVFIPAFGRKKIPNRLHAYYIGDAAGSIPPITGNGLSLGMQSGIMAANYALHRDYQGFKKASKALWSTPIFWGKVMHEIAMKPKIAKKLMQWGKHYLMHALYYLTR